MDKTEPGASGAPQAIARPCRGAMYRPRERTVQDLLRHTNKIPKPRLSPVLTDGARMQGPGVKEGCYNCGGFAAAEELQQCYACDRGFHMTCLDPPVNIVTLGVLWCCCRCDGYKSRGEDAGATGRTPGDSMISSQNTGGQWNSTAYFGKKKLANIRELKEVVQQEEASLVDSKSSRTASHEGKLSIEDLPSLSHTSNATDTESSDSSFDGVTFGETGEVSRRSKRGCPIRSTALVLPSKRQRIDSGISKPKPDDGNASSSVSELLGEVEELAVESKGSPVEEASTLGIDPSTCIRVADLVPEKVPSAVVKVERNEANVDSVGCRAGPVTGVDKEVQLYGIKLRDSDGIFQSLAMKKSYTESSAVVVLAKIPAISMVQVVKPEDFDAFRKVSAEIKLQDVDVDTHSGHVNDYCQASAAEAETGPPKLSTTLLSSPQNVGIQPPRNVVDQEGKFLSADQQVKEQGCRRDPLCSGKEEEIAAAAHAEIEHILRENPRRNAFDLTRNANLGLTTGLISSPASSFNSPLLSVKHSGPSPPFNNHFSSVSTTSSMSSASAFEGFQSQSRDVITLTSPLTLQFSKPVLEQSGVDEKISLVAKPLFNASGSSPSPSTATSHGLKPERSLPSDSYPCVEDKPQPAVPLSQSSAAPIALSTDVNHAEALDSQLSNLVSGLPLPAQRARKGSQASLPVFEVNGFLTHLGRKPKAQILDHFHSGLVHPSRASKELSRSSSMRDQGPVKGVLLKTLENGSSSLEPGDASLGRSKESNTEDDRDGSPSNLLVEDVKVCDTCGNAGYEELLALCSSCNEGAEHTYCMRIQMDSLPEGNWFCETCQIKQRQGGSKTLERVLVPSKSLGRSTSINSRPKPVSNQGSSRSRLVHRLNNRKPRIISVRKSPSKAPVVQTSVKRLPNDSLASPVSRKLATESSSWATSPTSSPSTLPVSTHLAKSSLTRESTFKSAPDTGKVKFLAPSAVTNFSSGSRANAIKPASAALQPQKTASAGHGGNKSRFASLSSISESSTPSNKATNPSSSRASLTISPTPILLKSSSGKLLADFSALSKSLTAKLSADFPSFLFNSNSRQGNGSKGSGQSKNNRDGGVPDGVSMPSSGKEAPSSASQPSGSKLMRLGRSTSSGLMGDLRPSPDTPRPILEHARGTQRPGPGIGGSNVTGTGQDASKVCGKDKASSRSEPAVGVGSVGFGRVPLEPASVPGFPSIQSKSNTSIWSAPWLGNSSSTWCFSCKTVEHNIQDCSNRTQLVSEQKAMSGLSNPSGTSPKPPKNPVLVSSDIDASGPAVGLKADSQEKANLTSGLQIAIESFPEGCSSDLEKSRPLLTSLTPTDLVRRKSPILKIHDSSAAGPKTPLLNSTSFQQPVTGETPGGVISVANGDISLQQGLKAESGPGSKLWTSGRAYDNEGPPGVPGTETVYVDSKVAALQNNILPLLKSERGSSPNASQGTGSKVPQGHAIQHDSSTCHTEAAVGPATQVLQRVHSIWGPPPPWLEALPPHATQSHGPGHVGHPSGLVQSFPPSGPVMYGQGPPISYLTSQSLPPIPPFAPTALPPVPSPTPPSPGAQVDAAVPSAAIAWRGAFEVHDGQSTFVFDEILAHVSTKAVAKVHEVATSLPQQLRLEQVRRATDLDTWPRQFNIRPPTDGSIALYFFATNGERFEKFRHNLVEKMVARDLVLRAQVDDAELLIFPSDKLSEKFQRWHGHMFLWGVFRARKQTVKTVSTSTVVVKGPLVVAPCIEVSKISPYFVPRATPVCNITPETKHPDSSSSGCDNPGEVDMEVDMEGGKECGLSDKPIKRPESANPLSTPPLSPTGASIRAPSASAKLGSAPECLAVDSDNADDVQGKPAFIKTEDLDLPPGFAPAFALSPTLVALETPTPGLTSPPGFAKRTEAQKQVDLRSSADVAQDPKQGSFKLKRSITSLEVVKSSSTLQTLPVCALSAKENADRNLLSSRPLTTKRSRSKSRSPNRPKEKERDKVRDRLCERVKDRDRRDPDSKHERRDRSRERARELHRDRDRDRVYEREKDRQRPRSRDRDRDVDNYERSKERARPRDKDRVRERDRARERDREIVRERERERERESERERLLDRGKDRKSYRARDSDQDLDSRIRYRRSRSRSRSRSPGRRKLRSRSPGAGRRKARSLTLPRQSTPSPSPSRRYPASYRQLSISGSDSPDSLSLEILQRSVIAGPRCRRPDRESVQGKRSVASDKDEGDKGSRLSSRWKSARPVDDTRSGSAGASNSQMVGKLGHCNTVTQVLDMNEGLSEAFSVEGAAASTSLPDLNTDSVESGVAFHDFLPADESGPSREPETASPIAEQTFFPGSACAAVMPSLSSKLTFRSQDAEPTLARERWCFGVSSLGRSRPDYTSRSSSGYQFLHAPRLEDSVYNPNPDLDLALGGRESTSSERTVPLPLFVDGHARSTPDLGFALNAKSTDLSVGLSTPHQLDRPGMACGGTASLSLSLAVPQYRREGNSWVQVEEPGDVSDSHDVDFSLTL
ncbi:hypothetical protein M758_UG069500 [Ceratodon purpureus]|nr:hypothetical protein M758_UG069500 [Ceratodon purpureus]